MPKSVFISVLQPPAADNENFTLNFIDNDDSTGSSDFSFTLTNLLHTDNEIQCAQKIYNGIQNGLALSNAVYNGTPVFNTDTFPFTFRPLIADHIVSMWSQSNYTIEISEFPTGMEVVISNDPVYITLSKAFELAPLTGLLLRDSLGNKILPPQLIAALKAASSKIVSILDGFVVIPTTYYQMAGGEWQRGVTTKYCPIIRLDNIVAKGPYLPQYVFSLGSSIIQRVEPNPETGSIKFLDWSNSVGLREASDFGNAIIWTYTAGYEYVTDSLGQITLQILALNQVPFEVQSFSGASFSMRFKDPLKAQQMINGYLNRFAI